MVIGGIIGGMKYTKRTKEANVKKVLKWYQRERGITDLDAAVDFPAFLETVEGPGVDFDDVVRAFDYVGVDLVAVPRGSRAITDWFSLTDMPYDDGGKHREKDGVWMKRHRLGRERGKK